MMCRCPGCYDCPSCQHTLSVRATNVTTSDAEGHATPRKAYYLACGFCRWTSRDIGLKDQPAGEMIARVVWCTEQAWLSYVLPISQKTKPSYSCTHTCQHWPIFQILANTRIWKIDQY